MDLIGDPGATELGFAMLLGGTMLLAVVFAIQTALLRRKLRKREAYSRQMEEMAFVDQLTGLPNRRLLFDRLQQALYAAERNRQTTSVYFIDLDQFKSINDRYGHDVGDNVLRDLGQRWADAFRATDTVARWGGDEFVAVISGIDSADDIRNVVERLQSASNEPFVQDGQSVSVKLSVGVAVGCLGAEAPEDLIRRADAAMYRAKRSGNAPGYEIVGRPECLAHIAGLAYAPSTVSEETEFVRVLV